MTDDSDDDPSRKPQAESPLPAELHKRRQRLRSPAGRIGRLRSWATVLVGLLALAILAWWLNWSGPPR